ncbi:MAG: hypothetical protein LBU13_03010 [Synergistaceae bacterium]|nr:hypothetical protein [Synergistaceae bacterium]
MLSSSQKTELDSDEFVLPSRRASRGKKRGMAGRIVLLWPFRRAKAVCAYFGDKLRVLREARESAILGYIPLKIFFGLCLVTLGTYPYVWIWGNAYAFNKMEERRVNVESLKRLAVLGFVVQTLLPVSAVLYAAWYFTGFRVALETAHAVAFAFVLLYLSVIFPMRCFNYFRIRWALRGAVIKWDSDGVMVGRAIPSWIGLFLFGSAYIQHHINRLMGLGMPGFADVSEIESDATLRDLIGGCVVTGKTDRVAAPWTKDDFEPEKYEDEYDYFDG